MNRWLKVSAMALAGTLVAGIVGVSVVAAADPTPPAATTTPQKAYGQLFMEKLAARLGITVDKYNEAVKGARQDVLDQQVKDGRITQDQANQMKDRLDKAPAGAAGFGGGMMGPRGGMRGGMRGTGTGLNGATDCPCN